MSISTIHHSNEQVWPKRLYAISIQFAEEPLHNGYTDIGRILNRHSFDRQQGSVYFGDDKVDPVRCVLAIQDVVKECPWFRSAVRDVRMLRIEENNDLMPAIEGVTLAPPGKRA